MTDGAMIAAHVHLVGSIGLYSVEEVVRTVGQMLVVRLNQIHPS